MVALLAILRGAGIQSYSLLSTLFLITDKHLHPAYGLTVAAIVLLTALRIATFLEIQSNSIKYLHLKENNTVEYERARRTAFSDCTGVFSTFLRMLFSLYIGGKSEDLWSAYSRRVLPLSIAMLLCVETTVLLFRIVAMVHQKRLWTAEKASWVCLASTLIRELR